MPVGSAAVTVEGYVQFWLALCGGGLLTLCAVAIACVVQIVKELREVRQAVYALANTVSDLPHYSRMDQKGHGTAKPASYEGLKYTPEAVKRRYSRKGTQ